MKRTAIIVFYGGNSWWFVGWFLHNLIWPDSPCSHYPNEYLSWVLGTTTFASNIDASRFWGLFSFAMFIAGFVAIAADSQKSNATAP
jgi:hypothetical protein